MSDDEIEFCMLKYVTTGSHVKSIKLITVMDMKNRIRLKNLAQVCAIGDLRVLIRALLALSVRR